MSNAKRLASFLTAVVMAFGGASVGFSVDVDALEIQYARSQTQNQSHMFEKDYTLTGNYADDLIAVAKAQLGKTRKNFQYYEEWCADFANDTARLTGMPDTIVPYNYGMRASCAFMYKYMIENCNAKIVEDVNDVRTGDYVFYYCPTSNFYLHVGIVESPEYYLEGNYNDMVQELPFDYNFQCYMHNGYGNNFLTGHVKRIYVRPDYPEPPKKDYTYTDPDKYVDYIPTRTLIYKEEVATSGYDVCRVQAVLYKLGYLSAVTGEYNKETVAAVKKFQTNKKITASGEVDETTLNALEQDYEASRSPSYSDFKTGKSIYKYADTINLSAKVANADSYRLVIKNSSGKVVKIFYSVSSCNFPASDIGSGAYTATLELTNSYKSVTSKAISFSVDNPLPSAAKLTVTSGSKYNVTKFAWEKTENTVSYDLYIKNSNGQNYIVKKGLTDTSYSVLLPNGGYTAYVVSANDYASTSGDTAAFTVSKGTPNDLGNKFYAQLTIGEDNLALNGSDKEVSLKAAYNCLSQSWYFVRNDDNSYVIKNCESGMVLTHVNHQIFVSKDTNTAAQNWYIAQADGNYFFIPTNSTNNVVYGKQGNVYTRTSSDSSAEAITLTRINAVHNYEVSELVAPTCTENGHVHYECIICGKQTSSELAAEGHKYTEEKLEGGHSVFTCVYCGDSYEIGKPTEPDVKDKLTLVETPDVPETPDTPDSPTPVDDKTTDEPRTVYDLTAIMGDVDGDGAITASDVLLISRASVGLEKLTDVGRVIADVDGDGKVTTADSLYVLRELVHLYTESKTGDIIHVQSEIDALKLFKDKDEEEKKKK